MDKISQIVRPNARVNAVDLNRSGGVRPGSPAFGRTVGESPDAVVKASSTADRATMVAQELADRRRASDVNIVDQLARDFFLSAHDPIGPALIEAPALQSPADVTKDVGPEVKAGYVPRGSFIDVQA